MKLLDNKNIFFYGLRRSGHHAILFWLLNKIAKPKHMEVGHTLFETNSGKPLIFFNDCSYSTKWDLLWEQSKLLDFKNKSHLSINFEEKIIKDPPLISNSSNIKIIIVRDFLNNISSLSKKHGKFLLDNSDKLTSRVRSLIDVWKDHVKYQNGLHVYYNSWLQFPRYKKRICKMLGIPETVNDEFSFVPPHGGGSSFIGVKKDEISNYLTRYKQATLFPLIIQIILDDQELLDLNKELFGMDIKKILT